MARSRFCFWPRTVPGETSRDRGPRHGAPAGAGVWFVLVACLAGAVSATGEPLGPCSRRTSLVISEILYHAGPRVDARNVEFIELYNSSPWPEDIGGYRLSGNVSFTFPAGTMVSARSFVLVALAPADILAVYGITGALGPWSGSLPNDAGTVRLRNRAGHVLLEVEYDSSSPWPLSPATTGHSLVLAQPSFGEASPAAWASSVNVGGSPRAQEPPLTDPLRSVVINEIVARSRAPELDYIELFNAGPSEVDLSGCVLTDDPAVERFVFPEGTLLGPRDYLALDEFILGFGFDAGGETIYLRNASRSRFLDVVRFESQAPGAAWGRSPDGAPEPAELETPTPLAPNPRPLRRDVVINEIMFAPLSGLPEDEYVELFNSGVEPVDLTGWEFNDGITFKFGAGTMLPAGGYLVVARSVDRLISIHPHLNLANCVGNFTGSLSKTGERLALRGRVAQVETNELGGVTTNQVSILADEVTYGAGGRWGRWSNRGGSSLELIDPRSDNRLAANWADSDETQKSAWTNATFTGTIDHVNPAPGANTAVQLLLLEPGEALVDDVIAGLTNGANVVSNPGFENGSDGWALQGSTEYSTLVPGGFTGQHALLLCAEGRGDPTANHVSSSAFSVPLAGPAILGAAARWRRGSPDLLLRLSGGGLELPMSLPVPLNLGTPGQPNSRLVSNAPPVISGVAHAPILPTPSQSVVVTARVQDSDSVTQVWLEMEEDGGSTETTDLWDDGLGADARAGDGVYSGTIPARASGTTVSFRVRATDGMGPPGAFPPMTGSNLPPSWCLVRFGEVRPAGALASYHLWLPPLDYALWQARPPTYNGWAGATLAYGTNRVLYNIGARYPEDPRHSDAWRFGPAAPARCDYALRFEPDDSFLGGTEAWITLPGEPLSTDTTDRTALREHLVNFLLESVGLPIRPRRPVHVFLNGNQRSAVSSRAGNFVMEDVAPVRPDLIAGWYENDPEGELIDIDEWAEANPSLFSISFQSARLTRAATPGDGMPVLKPAAYRWSWRRHALSAVSRGTGVTNFFNLVDAVSPASNPNSPSIADVVTLEAQADLEQWMRHLAVRHLVGNRSSYGYTRSRAAHAYRGLAGKFELLSGDVDEGFGNGDAPTAPLLQADDPRVLAMWNTPAFGRYYWQALNALVQGPFNNAVLDPLLDARAAALVANGIDINASEVPAIKSWIASRRSFVLSQIPLATFAVNLPTNFTTTSNLITLSGTGPTTAYRIAVNGVAYEATWTTLSNWTLRVLVAPVPSTSSTLTLLGVDRTGLGVTPVRTVQVSYTGPPGTASTSVVISEILYRPAVPRAAFIELFNTNDAVSFELSNWRLNGVEFTFPVGTYIANGQRLVVVRDRDAFRAAYGPAVPIAGVFPGELDPAGEVLTLIEPRSQANDIIAQRVHYGTEFPWPAATNGVALQLVDPSVENTRPANWRTSASMPATPGAPNSVAAPLGPAFPTVWLNEAQVVPGSFPLDDAGDAEPWTELFNPGLLPVSLNGLFLSNTRTNLTRWPFPVDATLAAKEVLLVWCDGEPAESIGRSWHTGFRLGADSPVLFLSRLVGGVPQVLDALDLSSAGGNSYGSSPDGQPFFRHVLRASSPGSFNIPVPLFINEWMASNSRTLADPADGDYDDWFEIYNPNDAPVDLGRYQIRDDNVESSRVALGTTIPAHGHLLVWADSEFGQNNASRTDLHVDFRLGAGGDSIELRAPYALDPTTANWIVDRVIFGGQATDVSGGRFPDGGAAIGPMRSATPRAPNSLPRNNSPPAFGPLPDRVVTAGQTLTFAVTVSDPEVPPQQLQFSLVPPAPAGAMIHPTSGAFSWAPTVDQAPSNHLVLVLVTDNGTPALEARTAFTVTVLSPPRVLEVVAGPQEITATLQLNPGHLHRTEFRDEIAAGIWMPLGEPFLAEAPVVTLSLPRGPGPQRFYRVVQLD